jgi:hypothetical protein
MKTRVVLLSLTLLTLSGTALAQERKGAERHAPPQQERHRTSDRHDHGRDSNRDSNRASERDARPQGQHQRMTPQQREKLRQDINEANRAIRR